uniref:Uncharacterized protein n=1 Tax=Cacopsylla melanoneura TaxID=428564 RepID=A0A8D9F9F6_9HEMI
MLKNQQNIAFQSIRYFNSRAVTNSNTISNSVLKRKSIFTKNTSSGDIDNSTIPAGYARIHAADCFLGRTYNSRVNECAKCQISSLLRLLPRFCMNMLNLYAAHRTQTTDVQITSPSSYH